MKKTFNKEENEYVIIVDLDIGCPKKFEHLNW